jgi:hypothetical protein
MKKKPETGARGTRSKMDRGAAKPKRRATEPDQQEQESERTPEPPRGFGVIMGDTADSLLPEPPER